MTRNRLRLSIYVASALLAVGGGAVAAVAATAPAAAPRGLPATFSKDSDWGSGYQARYTIKNTGGTAVSGWQLTFALPASAKLGSVWMPRSPPRGRPRQPRTAATTPRSRPAPAPSSASSWPAA